MQKHSRGMQSLNVRLLEAGTLRALQVAALHSSLRIDISRLAASGLQHLALACERLRLHRTCGNTSVAPVPSIHLFTWVRPHEATWVRHLEQPDDHDWMNMYRQCIEAHKIISAVISRVT